MTFVTLKTQFHQEGRSIENQDAGRQARLNRSGAGRRLGLLIEFLPFRYRIPLAQQSWP
jgi:hypothetical protein